jgi:hypothetical protein
MAARDLERRPADAAADVEHTPASAGERLDGEADRVLGAAVAGRQSPTSLFAKLS